MITQPEKIEKNKVQRFEEDLKDKNFIVSTLQEGKNFLSNPYANNNYRVDLKLRSMLLDVIKIYEKQKSYKNDCLALKVIVSNLKYGKYHINNSNDLKYYLQLYCKKYLRKKFIFSWFNKLGNAICRTLDKEMVKALIREITARDSVYSSSKNLKIFTQAKCELYKLKESFAFTNSELGDLKNKMESLMVHKEKSNQRIYFLEQENLRLNAALRNSIANTDKIILKMQTIVEQKVKSEMENFKKNFSSAQNDGSLSCTT